MQLKVNDKAGGASSLSIPVDILKPESRHKFPVQLLLLAAHSS
jgi:hypothetical protein